MPGSDTEWAGFELSDPLESPFPLESYDEHDGTKGLVSYFECTPGRGGFCRQAVLRKPRTQTVRRAAQAAAARRAGKTPAVASSVSARRIATAELTVGMHVWHSMKLAICTVRWIGDLAEESRRMVPDDEDDGAGGGAAPAAHASDDAPVDVFVEFFSNVGDVGTDHGSGRLHGGDLFASPRRDCCLRMDVERACVEGHLRRLTEAQKAECAVLEQRRAEDDAAVAARTKAHAVTVAEDEEEDDDDDDDDEEEEEEEELDVRSAASVADTEAMRLLRTQKDQIERWLQNPQYKKVYSTAMAIFSAMDWDGDGDLSFEEFEKSWFKGQHRIVGDPAKSARHTQRAIQKLGGSPVTHTITRANFVYHIVKKYKELPPHRPHGSSQNRTSFEIQLTHFVATAHEEKAHQILHAKNETRKAELAKRAKQEQLRSMTLKMKVGQLSRENMALKEQAAQVAKLRQRLHDANVQKMAYKMRLHSRVGVGGGGGGGGGGGSGGGAAGGMSAASAADVAEQKQQWVDDAKAEVRMDYEHRVEELMVAKDAAVREKNSMIMELKEVRVEMEELREKAEEKRDYGPLAVNQAVILSIQPDCATSAIKKVKEAQADLTGATRVMVIVRPFLAGNPDEKQVKWLPRGDKTWKNRMKKDGSRGKSKMTLYQRARGTTFNPLKWLFPERAGELPIQDDRVRTAFEVARYQTSQKNPSGGMLGPYCKTVQGAADCIFYAPDPLRVTGGAVLHLKNYHPKPRENREKMYNFTDLMPYNGPFVLTGAGKINYAAKQMQASQEHIWSKVRPLIESAVRKSPHNACIFAYGGTGSGKTYTMGGVDKEELKAKFKKARDGGAVFNGAPVTALNKDEWEAESRVREDKEIFYSTAACLLRRIDEEKEAYASNEPRGALEFEIEMRVADNYTTNVFDLQANALTGSGGLNRKGEMTSNGGEALIKCFTAKTFANKTEFWKLFKKAVSRRRTSAGVNASSSRSHLVICFSVTRVESIMTQSPPEVNKVMSNVIVVDLAGNEKVAEVQERLKNMGADKKTLKVAFDESLAINKALKELKNTMTQIIKLKEKAAATGATMDWSGCFNAHLTRLLAPALKPCQPIIRDVDDLGIKEERPTKVMMICCVAASSCWYDVTLGTLDFADQCMQMKLASADDIKANKAKVEEMDSLITGIAEVSAQVTAHLEGDLTLRRFGEMEPEDTKAWYDRAKELERKIVKTIEAAEYKLELADQQ